MHNLCLNMAMEETLKNFGYVFKTKVLENHKVKFCWSLLVRHVTYCLLLWGQNISQAHRFFTENQTKRGFGEKLSVIQLLFVRFNFQVVAMLFSHLGLCGLVAGYAAIGALAFRKLELPAELQRQGHMKNDTENVGIFACCQICRFVNCCIMTSLYWRFFLEISFILSLLETNLY